MYGAHMGSLALEGLDGNSWITLWATTGQQHANHQAPWTRQEVALSGRTIKKIRFKGTTTDTDRRDTARGVLSPLLANIYLHPLDKLVTEAGMKMVRDDFVILCEDKTQAEEALWLVREWSEDNGLTLHPDKTHLGDCSQPGQGFEFLGIE
uniref:Reverse transcriptase (RNA-dependent DNA polymerase) n=1 Tax=Candidatus Kentrum sp. SD TaxID=2126332 RepID=A0A450YIB2_9GAMM|nr:MAG: Reverse transcriptase (RNA-dependent DNA polymerase) [Candidatus Kentron sp. SD]VFK46968.1 MAG: Reverse transcriptase (RNA-dependent DNA polymerase) [Candidatus Kentron sp. SD]